MKELNGGLKWHGFVSTWGMLLLAFGGIGRGLLQLGVFGSPYGDLESRAIMYGLYPSLRGLDVALAIAYFAAALFALYTGLHLLAFRKGAPRKLDILQIVFVAIPIVQVLAVGSAIDRDAWGESMAKSEVRIRLLVIAGLFIFNHLYYKRHGDRFDQ